LRLSILVILALLMTSITASAQWKEYPMPQLGFIVEFPAAPASSTGTYKTGFVVPSPAPVHVYTVREPNEIFMATVADLLDRKEEGATILVEAFFNLNLLGDMTAHSTSRVETGRNAIFGHFVTIKCRGGRIPDQQGQTETAHAWFKGVTGMDCPDGNRLMVNLFFTRGRQYMMIGMSTPDKEDGSFGPDALRFTNSISFYRADGTRDPADQVK
jgi:hypothetical protein